MNFTEYVKLINITCLTKVNSKKRSSRAERKRLLMYWHPITLVICWVSYDRTARIKEINEGREIKQASRETLKTKKKWMSNPAPCRRTNMFFRQALIITGLFNLTGKQGTYLVLCKHIILSIPKVGPYRDVLIPDFIFHMLINFMFLGIYPFLLGCLVCWYMIVNSISWSLLFLFIFIFSF